MAAKKKSKKKAAPKKAIRKALVKKAIRKKIAKKVVKKIKLQAGFEPTTLLFFDNFFRQLFGQLF